MDLFDAALIRRLTREVVAQLQRWKIFLERRPEPAYRRGEPSGTLGAAGICAPSPACEPAGCPDRIWPARLPPTLAGCVRTTETWTGGCGRGRGRGVVTAGYGLPSRFDDAPASGARARVSGRAAAALRPIGAASTPFAPCPPASREAPTSNASPRTTARERGIEESVDRRPRLVN
jgi:hypothetical protein